MLAVFAFVVITVLQGHVAMSNTLQDNHLYGNAYTSIRRYGWHSNRTAVRFGTAITLEEGKRYSTLSKHMTDGYELFLHWLNQNQGGIIINGSTHPVELVFINDESKPDHVEWATDKLVNDFGINLLLGPYSSGLTNYAAKIANQSGATMVASGAASAFVFEGRPQVFGTSTPANQWFEPAMTMFSQMPISQRPKTIAYLQEDVGFTKFACSSIPTLAVANGMTVVYSATVTRGADQSEILTVVKAMDKIKPDVVFSCNYDAVCQNLIRASRQANFNPKAFLLTTCVPGYDFIQTLGQDGFYVLGTAAWTSEVGGVSEITNLTARQFNEMYEARFDVPPHYLAAAAFAGISMYVHSIQTTNSLDPQTIANALRLANMHTEYGRVQFDDIGLCKKTYSIIEWRDRVETTIVDTTKSETPTYPKPTWHDLQCLNQESYTGLYGYDEQGLNCGRCPEGKAAKYSNITRDRRCKACPIGETLVTTGDIGECKFCAAGKFWCGEGWYAPDYPSHIALDLREENVCEVSGVSQCRDCPAGRYSDAVGLTLCKACQPGKYQNVPGKVECTECAIWDKRYPTAFSAVSNSISCVPCPLGAFCELDFTGSRSTYTNDDDYYFVPAVPLDYGSELPLGKLYKCPHGDGKACVAKGNCYVDEMSGEVSMEGPFCGDCKPGFARGENDKLCTKCGSPLKSWALGFSGACIIFGVSLWLTVCQLFKDPRALLPGMYVILRQFMNYVAISTVVIPVAHFSSAANSILEKIGGFAYVAGSVSPLSAATGTECYLRYLFPGVEIYQAWIIAGFSLVPCWLVFDVCVYSVVWLLCRCKRLPTPSRSQFVLGLAMNLYVLQPRLTQLFLIPFDCNYLDYPRLMAKLSVKCDQDITAWQIFSVFGLLIFSFGIPLALIGALYFYRKTQQLHSVECAERFGFLFQGFKPGYYYWEAILMMRKVLFQIVAYIPWFAPVGQNPEVQKAMTSVSLLLLSIVFLAIHLRYKPYDFRDFRIFHEIESAMLWAMLITSLSQVWLYCSSQAWVFTEASDNMTRNRRIRDAVITIVVISFHARFFVLAIWGVIGSSVRATERWQRWSGGNTLVTITQEGININTLSMNAKAFLSDLVHQAARGTMKYDYFCIDDLIEAIKQLVVESYYQRDIIEFEAKLPFMTRQIRGFWYWMPKSIREAGFAKRVESRVLVTTPDCDDCPWRSDPYNFVWNPNDYARTIGQTFSVEDMLLAYVNIAWRHEARKSKRLSRRDLSSPRVIDRPVHTPPKSTGDTRSLRQEAARSDTKDSPAILNPVMVNDAPLQVGKPVKADEFGLIPKAINVPGVVFSSSIDASIQKASQEREYLLKALQSKEEELSVLAKQRESEDFSSADSEAEEWS